MIRVTNTPNLTGVTISGDYEDLANDVRHAAQGDREMHTEANGLTEWHAEALAEAGRTLPRENLRYLKMNRDTRAEKLVTITKRFAEHLFDPEDRDFRRAIEEAVEEYGCAESDLRFEGLDYPEEIEW